MSDKIAIELTQLQLDSLKAIIKLGTDRHQNSELVLKSLPNEITKDSKCKIPKDEPDDDFLIIMGSISDRGRYSNGDFLTMFKKYINKYPESAKRYLEKMFDDSKNRNFTFNADFRKDVAKIGLDANILPDNAKLYYAKTYASKGFNGDFVIKNLSCGNMPDEAWDILARSNRYEVLIYILENGPDNILPLLVNSISSVLIVDQYSELYSYKTQSHYGSEYLEYRFEHRIATSNGQTTSKPLSSYKWMSKNNYQ